jgi:hypothetical protein
MIQYQSHTLCLVASVLLSISMVNIPYYKPYRRLLTNYVTVEMSREDSQSKVSKRNILSRRELEKEAARAIGENLEPQWKRALHI